MADTKKKGNNHTTKMIMKQDDNSYTKDTYKIQRMRHDRTISRQQHPQTKDEEKKKKTERSPRPNTPVPPENTTLTDNRDLPKSTDSTEDRKARLLSLHLVKH